MHHKVVTTAQYLTLIGRRMKKKPDKGADWFCACDRSRTYDTYWSTHCILSSSQKVSSVRASLSTSDIFHFFRKLRQCSCFCLASASGVMAYVSLVEVFQEGKASFKDAFDIMAKEHVENEGMIFRLRRFRPQRPGRNSKLMQNSINFSGQNNS